MKLSSIAPPPVNSLFGSFSEATNDQGVPSTWAPEIDISLSYQNADSILAVAVQVISYIVVFFSTFIYVT